MKKFAVSIILIILLLSSGHYAIAGDYRVVFAANLHCSGSVYREDHSGADLYSVLFDPQAKTVTELTQLTDNAETSEWFPSLSPDAEWIVYNFQRGNVNSVHLLNFASGRDTLIVEDARFPEWIDDASLLVSKKVAGVNDVFKVNLDLSGESPVVTGVDRITNRARCLGASMGEDPFPFANGQMLIFHTLRSDPPPVPAAIAGINMDGTNYRQLTDWNGSGHGIVNSDGSKIVCSVASTGTPAVLQLDGGSTASKVLPLSTIGSDAASFDARFAGVPKVHWTYAAWAEDEHSVLLSAQGSSAENVFSFSRLLHVSFDENWESPEIFDLSSAIEHLAGVSERDFCTASMRSITVETAGDNRVYVSLFLGNNNPVNAKYPDYSAEENRDVYIESRNHLVQFCELCADHNVPINWMSNWNFLNGVLKWETPELMANTDGKNVVRYLSENLGISIGAHCHEDQGYNYADNAHLIDSLGVTPSNVVGGHLWNPDGVDFQNWEKFRRPLQGEKFPHAYWKADILVLHASSGHSSDPEPSGVWKPQDKNNFWVHDSSANLYAIGQYKNNFRGVLELVDQVKSGVAPENVMLAANINFGQSQLNDQFIASFEHSTIEPLLEMQENGEIKLATYNQVIEEWKSNYDSVGYIYNSPAQSSASKNENRDLKFMLLQNYPNPFNQSTTITFRLPATMPVNLVIYDLKGKEVRTLIQGEQAAGEHSVAWDGWNNFGGLTPSGVYFYRLQMQNNVVLFKKMLLIK